jgi:ABC-type branched-subunit amino acid transport system substrate-binding protein
MARHLVRSVTLTLMAIMLAGCSDPGAPAGKSASTPRPVWQIGFLGASGVGEQPESQMSGDGAQLAIDTLNQSGGILWNGRRYDLALDSGGSADLATRIGQLAYSPSVVALLGPDDDSAAIDTAGLVATAGMPELTLATDPGLSNQHGASIFQLRPPDIAWARAAVSVAVHTLGLRSIAVAAVPNAYGARNGSALDAALASLKIKAVAQVSVPMGLPDPAAAISQIAGSEAAAVICACTDYEAAMLIRALRASGWAGQFLDASLDSDFIAEAGSAGNGTIGIASWSAAADTTGNAAFIAAFTQRYDLAPDPHAAALYDAVDLIAAGLQAVGPDHAALAGYLASLKGISGVQGSYDAPAADRSYNAQTVLTQALYVVKDEDGQIALLQAFS